MSSNEAMQSGGYAQVDQLVVELFAGPGGASQGMRTLGLDPVGIEWDADACRTRAAAGHRTIRADVSQVATGPFVGKVWGLWGSPPCPTFSSAGDGSGREEMAWLLSFVERFHRIGWHLPLAWHEWTDPRTPLVLEPLRWLDATQPTWIVLEQVPSVLPLWESYAHVLQERHYSVRTAVLNAADYGVPQTRERAILVAHRNRPVSLPAPTHAAVPTLSLFGELERWVAMEDVLTFDDDWRLQQWRGAGMVERHGERPDRPASEPAFTITGASTRTMRWVCDRRTNSRGPQGTQVPTVPVPVDRPAPTLTGKAGHQWIFRNGDQAHATVRRCDQPAPTILGSADNGGSVFTDGETKRKLTIREALILQSFPEDYPVQGTKTSAFQQIGNAVPPRLAEVCVREVAA